jgi:sterol 3beta-glucosyltransferase
MGRRTSFSTPSTLHLLLVSLPKQILVAVAMIDNYRSEALIPKPKDWGPNINVAGYFFLEGAKTYKPPKELTDFLNAGQPPVYIGFGSIVVDDPAALTKLILTAVKTCAIRAVVLRGWSELGSGNMPEGIYLLENVPHDWLFPRVSAVVHHGGAGTTAIGIASGKPTVVVPFFGDQGFWGAMIHRAGAVTLQAHDRRNTYKKHSVRAPAGDP